MKYISVSMDRVVWMAAKKIWVEAGQPRKRKLFKAKYRGHYPCLPWRFGIWGTPGAVTETTDGKYWAVRCLKGWCIFTR